jgi:chromosome segregation ATPase
VIEGILLFALGFLAAALLALMIAPAVWNRAVTLTRRRIEASVPLTLNEIQADKDQLRAEFAMSTRRLEMSIEELREKAAGQVIEIGRKRDELARLTEESRERIRSIEELKLGAADLQAQLKEREDRLAKTNARLDETRALLEERALELERVRGQLRFTETDSDSRRIELVAKQTTVENMSDRMSEFVRREKELVQEAEAEKRRAFELEKRLERMQKQVAELESGLETRERDLAMARETRAADDQLEGDMTSQLMAEKQRVVELESKLAQTNLLMESLLNDASNENVKKAMASMHKERARLEKKLKSAVGERDRLKSDHDAMSRNKSEEWEQERRENAILRERINDLAAQVTAMTAAIEGDNSAINEILAKAPRPGAARAGAEEEGETGKSLADRIRQLQDAARRAKAG